MKTSIRAIINTLVSFWRKKNFIQLSSSDTIKGASTCNSDISLLLLNKKKKNFFVLDRCRRAEDAKNSVDKKRLYLHHQFEVITSNTKNILNTYFKSLKKLQLLTKNFFLEIINDNWKNPSLGAYGLGWEVRINNLEISQITFFKKIFSLNITNSTCEITYGIERIALLLQNKKEIMNLNWDKKVQYKELFYHREKEMEELLLNRSYLKIVKKEILLLKKKILFLIQTNKKILALETLNQLIENINIFNSFKKEKNLKNKYLLEIEKISKQIGSIKK